MLDKSIYGLTKLPFFSLNCAGIPGFDKSASKIIHPFSNVVDSKVYGLSPLNCPFDPSVSNAQTEPSLPETVHGALESLFPLNPFSKSSHQITVVSAWALDLDSYKLKLLCEKRFFLTILVSCLNCAKQVFASIIA